jgi:hypothetical protein
MKQLIGLGLLAGLGLGACGGAPVATQTPSGPTGEGTNNVGTIALENRSQFDIYSIQLSPFDRVAWGANLIEGDALLHGEAAQLAVFDCRKYDLRLVDDAQIECVIEDIDLCFEDKQWTLDDDVLASCTTGWAN